MSPDISPELSELEPGDKIKYFTANNEGEQVIPPTEARFLGTTHGAVRLKGEVPDKDVEPQEYKVGEMKIHIMARYNENEAVPQ